MQKMNPASKLCKTNEPIAIAEAGFRKLRISLYKYPLESNPAVQTFRARNKLDITQLAENTAELKSDEVVIDRSTPKMAGHMLYPYAQIVNTN
mmetsp:Transcript_12452/g.37971  ORF Transcript_12452/g.37971 Transcript_12452/m.37971 type:complete len:93 (-) Transcript_12452:638-916(-)